MDKIELARKALLDTIGAYVYFPCVLRGSEGGACGDGYSTSDEELELSADELLYLISDDSEVFKGLPMTEIDVDDRLYEMAKKACWPDFNGNPSVHLSDNDTVPEELQELADEIRDHDKDDDAVVADLRARIAALQDGDYTFNVTVRESEYYFKEDEPETLHLTGDEVRGFLRYALDDAGDVFDGICDEGLNEDDFSDLAEEAGVGSEYIDDYWSYGGESCALEEYISAWKTLIKKIMSGEVDEANIDKWLPYFNDSDNWDDDIDWWKSMQDD